MLADNYIQKANVDFYAHEYIYEPDNSALQARK